MNRFACLFIFIGVFLVVSRFGNTACYAKAELEDVVSTIEQGYRDLRDVQADFSQTTALASIKKEQRGAGTLVIKKTAGAAMFRFDYTKPRQLIVSDGKTVWFHLPENRQVMVSDMASLFEGQSGVTLNYLTSLDRLSRDFNAAFAGSGRDEKGNYVLELIPKKKGGVVARLQITVAEQAVEQFVRERKANDPFPVVSSVVQDAFGTTTSIEFSRIRVNRGVGNSLFKFRIPQGVEVIRR